ncbi:hypothetical protein B4Q13_19200 [Lacticaseibacillus rhamnosus]
MEDQVRLCRARADREGWNVLDVYVDHATSGATTLRPGYQALMAALRVARWMVRADPTTLRSYFALARAYEKLDRHAEAEQALRPQFRHQYNEGNVGQLYRRQDEIGTLQRGKRRVLSPDNR